MSINWARQLRIAARRTDAATGHDHVVERSAMGADGSFRDRSVAPASTLGTVAIAAAPYVSSARRDPGRLW